MTGLTLAHYRIEAELGRGGMGIVYKATDTKLNRTVALKVLPAAALASEDDRSRFFREAQAAAQLHHPHIATVFQIDEAIPVEEGKEVQPGAEKRLFIAMEFIDGVTVADRIKTAPLPLSEVVSFATQIGEALRAAHDKDIVHRDIKSANVMLTKDGIAKVLDFGLAKTNQSTMLTRQGSTLGTVAYMSPEQARGQEVDGRTDLYALGTMIYEMVAGRLPFSGDYEQAVLYGILNESAEPLTALRTGVPMQLEFVVNKLLSKEPDYRYQTAADLLADLKSMDLTGSGHSRRSVAAGLTKAPGPAVALPTPTNASVPKWVWGALAGVLVAGLGLGWLIKPVPEAERPLVRTLDVPIDGYQLAIMPTGSPDGKYWAFNVFDSTNAPQIVLWNTRSGTSQELQGLEGHFFPRFSPSSRWLLSNLNGHTYRTLIPTGRPILVDSLNQVVWLSDDEVMVAYPDSTTLARIDLLNGQRSTVETSGLDSAYVDLSLFTSSGKEGLLLVDAERADGVDDILSLDVESGLLTPLVRNACCGTIHENGWLIYYSGSDQDYQVVAQRFDADRLELLGVPVDLVASVDGPARIGLGGDDTFMDIYTFDPGSTSNTDESLSWIDADGQVSSLGLPIDDYDRFAFSPEGDRIAIERVSDAGLHIYAMDLDTGTRQRLTYDNDVNRVPVWTRSGKIYYAAGPPQESSIYVKNADGSGDATLVVENGDFPTVSVDEEWLVYTRETNGGDIIALNLLSGEVVPIDTSATRANDPEISRDGRYLAYSVDPNLNNTVGTDQRVVVRSFPDPSLQYVQVAEVLLDDPKWSPDGTMLYVRSQGLISRIQVSTTGAFQVLSAPETVAQFQGQTIRTAFSPVDGRLLVMHPGASIQALLSDQQRMRVIFSFSRYLDELVSQ